MTRANTNANTLRAELRAAAARLRNAATATAAERAEAEAALKAAYATFNALPSHLRRRG